MDAGRRGAAALEAGNYDEAVKLYTAALQQLPKAVDYYLKRSSAYQRSSPPDLEAALRDAELGLHFAFERAKRELIGQAQMRRVAVLFNMGQYANAQFALGFVKQFDKANKATSIWEAKIETKLAGLPADDPNANVTIVEHPPVKLPEEGASRPKTTSSGPVTSPTPAGDTTAAAKPPVTQTPASQIRHDWYQNNTTVFLSLLAKGLDAAHTTIEMEERCISISFPTPTGADYSFTLDPLFGPIDPTKSSSRLTPTKLELTLAKAAPGLKWKSLEAVESEPSASSGPAPAPSTSSPSTTPHSTTTTHPPQPAPAPASTLYPSSSRTGPKNWDALVSLDGADDDDDAAGDEADQFFKKLYAGADPDTRRAMMKSYVESNGTVLSTNWAEVGTKPVETSPPDGMEARSWSA